MTLRVDFKDHLDCPVCGIEIYSLEKLPMVGRCPHLLFIYGWDANGDDCFISVREDFAKFFVAYLKTSKEYQDYKESYDEEGFDPVDATTEEKFVSGKFEPLDEVSVKMARFGIHLPDICPENSTVFCDEHYYSGIFIGIES